MLTTGSKLYLGLAALAAVALGVLGWATGWQMQANAPSVQQRLTEAIEAFCGEHYIPRGAGRTDSGVHARGQVAHIDLAKDWPADTVMKAVNAALANKRPEWNFTKTLTHTVGLPSNLDPIEGLHIGVAWGKRRISQDALVLVVSFKLNFVRGD